MHFKKDDDVEEIDFTKWDNFQEIHQQSFGEGYWNFERIKNNFDLWKIYAISENQRIKTYIYVKSNPNDPSCEIFGIYGDDLDERLRLIKHTLNSLQDKKRLYYFVEDEQEMEACKALGFTVHGHYQAWAYKVDKVSNH